MLVYVGSCLLFWDKVPRFLGLAFSYLADAKAKLSQFCSALLCCKIFLIFYLVFYRDRQISSSCWKTPRTAVPMRAVILKHGL